MVAVALLIIVSLLVLLWAIHTYVVRHKHMRRYKFPPGPGGLPLAGNLHQIWPFPHLKLSQWAYAFGKTYTISLVGKKVLVVNDVTTLNQIFGLSQSTGRFKMDTLLLTTKGPNGIVMSEGEIWQEQRTFMVKALKDCGFHQSNVTEPIILAEADDMVSWLKSESSRDPRGIIWNFRDQLVINLSNVIWNLVIQSKTDSRDRKVGLLTQRWFESIQKTSSRGLIFFPFLKYIAPEWSGYNELWTVCNQMEKVVEKFFKDHEASPPGMDRPKDLIDAYIEHMKNCKDPTSSFYGVGGYKHSFFSVVALLIAGGESLATTINWMIHYLTAYPEVQKKLHEEVDIVIGSKESPALMDKKRMPYLKAFLLETLRFSSFIPFGLIHRLLEDIEYENYRIPKDTVLLANLYHSNYDRNVWKDGHCFRPERFLEGSAAHQTSLRNSLASFQPGKRRCPGEKFTHDALFLFAIRILQAYEFRPIAESKEQSYVEPSVGFNLQPKQVGIIVQARK